MYGDIEQNRLCALATIIDPRFKLKCFSSAGNASHARMLLTTECENYLTRSTVSSPEDQPRSSIQESILTLPLQVTGVSLVKC